MSIWRTDGWVDGGKRCGGVNGWTDGQTDVCRVEYPTLLPTQKISREGTK